MFWEAAARLQRRTVKVECVQNYYEPGNKSWEALVSGDFKRSMELIEEDRASHKRKQKVFDDTGAPFYRVRVVQYPLSTYTKWELAHFGLNAEIGEIISVVDTAHIADIEIETNLSDFVLFDEYLMLAYDYTSDGIPLDTHVVTDSTYLREVSKLADELLERSHPFEKHKFQSPALP